MELEYEHESSPKVTLTLGRLGGINVGPKPRWWEWHVHEPGGPLKTLKLVTESTVSYLNKSEGLEICSGNVVKGP